MTIEEEITFYLKNKYKPLAILLTGSRAEGKTSQFSDWDIIILTDNKSLYGGEVYKGQDLDVTLKKIDSVKDGILATRWSPYRTIKILFDKTNGTVEKVVKKTMAYYKKGRPKLSKSDLKARIEFDTRRLKKIKAYQHIPGAFMHNLTVFHDETIGHWFELRKMWIPNIAEALEYIQWHDKKFYILLTVLPSNKSVKAKIKAAERILDYLYKNNSQ